MTHQAVRAPYISTPAAAQLHGRSHSYIVKAARAGKIPGAILVANRWLIPAGWTPPPKEKPGPKLGFRLRDRLPPLPDDPPA